MQCPKCKKELTWWYGDEEIYTDNNMAWSSIILNCECGSHWLVQDTYEFKTRKITAVDEDGEEL